MDKLAVIEYNRQFVVDSRDVAERVEKDHADLLKSIRSYIDYLIDGNFPFNDFYIESEYKDSIGRTLPCYLITRKGCDMIAHKMTGKKGVLFTATYITRFEEMEKELRSGPGNIRLEEINVKKADILMQIAEKPEIRDEYKQVLYSHATAILTGHPLLPLPESEKTYSAGDISSEIGITANMIGRYAKLYNIKTDEYGKLYHDKSPYSCKQVDTFRYNEKGKQKLIEIAKENNLIKEIQM